MAKDGLSTILLLGAVGVGGWYLYSSGMLASFGIGAPAAAAPPPPTGGGTTAPAATTVPPLGTTVTTAAQVLQQAAANDPYIIPDAPTFAMVQTALPNGYNWVNTSDKGGVLLRPDVYSAVNAFIQARVARATGGSPQSITNASTPSLADIQGAMTNSGLSGLGDFMRHMSTRTGVRFRV